MATIQSRLSGSSPGQLSIADARSGELSLADEDPRGRVSLTVEESVHQEGRTSRVGETVSVHPVDRAPLEELADDADDAG